LVKSQVDEKNLDEEISKIKAKLADKIAERKKSKKDKTPMNDDDDFFNSAGNDQEIGRRSRGGKEDDGEMEVDERPTRRKRSVQEVSDDDIMEIPTTKKPRKAPAKAPARATAKAPPVSRSRRSSDSSTAAPVRKTPARAAASRIKKVSIFWKLS